METNPPATQTSNNYNTAVLSALVVFLLVVSGYLFLNNAKLSQDAMKMVKNVPVVGQALNKSTTLTLLYDPNKPYVTSTTVYQQMTGMIVKFDPKTGVATFRNGNDVFTVKLPVGKNNNSTLPAFADLSGLTTFQTGDTIVVGGQYDTKGNFQVTRFVVSQKGF